MKAKQLLSVVSFFALAVFVLPISSCALFGGFVEAAHEAGVIDNDTADSLKKANASIEKAAEVITPEQEYYIGRAVAANLLTKYRLYSAPAAEKYLNSICRALVINSPRPELFKGYHVAIMNTDEINAFATPGGHILISRGLLRCTDSEDAVAAVIAHEIAHIQLQHSIKAIKSGRAVDAIFATTDSAVKLSTTGKLREITDSFSEGVDDIVSNMVEKGYSKTQEFDADKTALALMSSAGYNPHAMLDMLQLLENRTDKAHTGFGKTHPSPSDRISRVKMHLVRYPEKNYQNGMAVRKKRFKNVRLD